MVPVKVQVPYSTAQRVHPVTTVVSGAMRASVDAASLPSKAVVPEPPQATSKTAAHAAASVAGEQRCDMECNKVIPWVV